MFTNYIKITLRNLFKNKAFSLINIGGITLGLVITILILLYVRFELGFDRFHENAQNIYRIAWMSDNSQTRTPHPMAQAMVRDFPEVVNAVTLSPIWGPGLTRPKLPVRYEDKKFDEPGFYSADTTFFKVFSFPLVAGDPKKVLKIPGGVVITESIAHKYFGDDDPLGKTMILEVGQDIPMTVTGVMKDVPPQSHFHFDFLISYITLKPMETGEYFEWSDFGHFNYIVLAGGVNPQSLESKIPKWAEQYLGWSEEGYQALREGRVRFVLQPVTDIHLRSNIRWELEPNSSMSTIYLFISAALLILIIACINFMNLSTARSTLRAKEIGIRKVVGADRWQLFWQFLGESMILAFIAAIMAIILIKIILPFFNVIAGRELKFDLVNDWMILCGIVTLTLFVGFFAGSYPAIFLSAFRPVTVLKGKMKAGMKNVTFRRVMVVLQFSISIALIAATGIVNSQLHFLRNQKLGFDKDQLLVVPMKNPQLRNQYESIKNELNKLPEIISSSAISNVPGSSFNQNPITWEARDEQIDVSELRVDHDFVKTLGLEIAAGRTFSREFSTDLEHAYILNETAARNFTWEDPINQEIVWYDDEVTRRGEVIGVVKDFHFKSLHVQIEPLIIHVLPEEFGYMLIKIQPQQVKQTIASIEKIWNRFDPGHAFEYSFLDEDFQKLYQAEEHIQFVFRYFTILAIFIACLGLYGLMTFATQQRMKEISIRKIAGASVQQIVFLLSKEFTRWVLVANLIAWPVAWLVMRRWLQEFAYQVDIHLSIFIVAGGLALIIAFLTVSLHTIKAALARPVETLRYE